MNRISSIIFSTALFFLSSCSSLTYFDLPVYMVTETPFPAIGESVVLVNNAVEQPERVGSSLVYSNNKEQILIYERDSANFPMLDMLGQQLMMSNFLSDVTIYNIPMRTDSLYRNAAKLTKDQLHKIEQESGADWILSLDAMPHITTIKEKKLTDFNLVTAQLQIQVTPVFRLYHKGSEQPVKHYYIADTVKWDATQIQLDHAIQALPSINECFRDALYFAGEKAVQRWLPYVEQEQRCWVNYPHSIMREARNFLIADDRESAAYMWEYGYEKAKNQKVRYYCAYNRAVLAEMDGELENALGWIEKANSIMPQDKNIHHLDLDHFRASVQKQIRTQKMLVNVVK